MPRLLLVATIPRFHEAFLGRHAAHFRSRGWDVEGMARRLPGHGQAAAPYDRTHSVKWSRSALDPRNLLVGPRRVRRIVAERRPDIVHVHTPVAGFVTRWALRRLRRRTGTAVVYTAHGFHFHPHGSRWSNFLFRSLERLAGRWTDRLVVINEHDRQAAREAGLVPTDALHHIPGVGIDLDFYRPETVSSDEGRAFRTELGLDPDTPLVTMIAEFNPGKRHRDLVQAVAGLEGVHAALAGGGPQVETVASQARELRVADRIHLVGFREDVRPMLAAADIFALPSEREGLPRSVMEALAMEVAVIGTDARGIRDLVGSDAGLLFEVGDVEGLRRAIERLLDDPDARREMGRRGRERMRDYALEEVLRAHEELYHEILEQRNRETP